MAEFINWYVSQVDRIGWDLYVFVGMFIESTILPLPSEVIMPPAGHHAHSFFGLLAVIFIGTAGSLVGSSLNYLLGYWLGRPFFEKYGKYCFVGPRHLAQLDAFWARRGEGSTLIARFVPGIRHLISIPAGILRMNFGKFIIFTALGAGGWNAVLAIIGWSFRNWTTEDFERNLKHQMTPYVLAAVAVMVAGYIFKVFYWNPKHGRR